MPILTLPIYHPTGPLITVNVSVGLFRAVALSNAKLPTPPTAQAMMLIDTGASITALDQSIIDQLVLPRNGFALCHTSSTEGVPHQVPLYDVQLELPLGMPNQQIVPRPHVLSFNIQVMASHFLSQGIQGLIGRDILSACHLVYNGPNSTFTLSV